MLMKMRGQMQKGRNQKGFTLVELMVVVVIIGILAAIAVPVYNNVTAKAKRNAVEANLRTIDGAIMSYRAANDGKLPTEPDLYTSGATTNYLQNWPTGPDGVTYAIDETSGKATASKGTNTGDWWTTGDSTISLPINW
mgnify:CR=1 FL=1